MIATRKDYQIKLRLLLNGKRFASHTNDTINVVNLCAQFVRQTVEDIEALPPNGWQVGGLAVRVASKRGRSMRWSVDYEEAGRQLNLVKSIKDVQTGDVGYWEYIEFGHTAIAVFIDNKLWWLENTNAKARKGGRRVFGAKTAVWLTPADVLGPPRTLIAPTRELLQASSVNKTKIEEIMKDLIGTEIYLIEDGGEPEYVGKLQKASEVDDKKVYIKTKTD